MTNYLHTDFNLKTTISNTQLNMPEVNFQNHKFKCASAVIIVFLAIVTGIIMSSLHKIEEGSVGVYYKYGALMNRTTGPGKLYNIFRNK